MKQRTALELYAPHAFRFVLMLATGIALLACATFTLGHFAGFFNEVSLRNILILDGSGLFYVSVCGILSRFLLDRNDELLPGRARWVKILLGTLTIVHWNMISYLIPFRAFWGFGPLFLLTGACLLDETMVILEGIGLLASAIVSWYILPDKLGVPLGANHFENIFLRIECLVLSYGLIYVLTRVANILLTRATEQISEYDPLTSLRNRRSLDVHLKKAGDIGQTTYSVAVIDIDDFKALNASCGHLFGDTVIRRVAEILTKSIRDEDMVFRLGNDDFLILFGDDCASALAVCRRILHNIRLESFSPSVDTTRRITVTVGLHGYTHGSTADRIIEGADANVALGKRSGRNCIVYSEQDGSVRYTE